MELAREVFPYAKIALQTLFISRIVLFVLALKWRKLTRVVMFLEITIFWV